MPYSDALTDEEIDALVGVYAVRAELAGKRAVLAERECARLQARVAELEADGKTTGRDRWPATRGETR